MASTITPRPDMHLVRTGLSSLLLDDVGELLELSLGSEEGTELDQGVSTDIPVSCEPDSPSSW
jgi:hypothetical protein